MKRLILIGALVLGVVALAATGYSVFSVAGGKFRVDSDGDLVRIRNVSYSWPATSPGNNTYLKHVSGGTLSWESVSGGGDMYKSVYDTDNDNIVDEAEVVNDGAGNRSSAAQVKNAVNLAHSNANDPTSDQKAALAGTHGSPSGTNRYVTNSDPRNSDARTPLAHGSSAHTGTIGTWAQIDKTTSNIADITTRSHTSLTDIGTNTHAQIDSHISASAPHSGHVIIGGQLGGTATSPDVRGMRETSGPTLLTYGSVSDGQYLRRSGSSIVGATITAEDNISVNGTAATDADFDDVTPSAPSGGLNVKWQKNNNTPNDISAYVSYASPITVSSGALTVQDATSSTKGVIQIAGQIGGSATSIDVRGLRETSGPTLLTMGSVSDGQYLMRSGTSIIGGTPSGGSNPPWYGYIAGAYCDGDPERLLTIMQTSGVVSPTPTNIGTTVARIAYFRLPASMTCVSIRWYGVGDTSGIYHVAIYRDSDSARLTADITINTTANSWGAVSCGSVSLAANTLYFIALSAGTTGTTAGILGMAPTVTSTTGQIAVLPTSWPGSLDIDVSTPRIRPCGFAQFAVTSGALPNPAPARSAMAAWTGGMGAFFIDSQ